MDLPRISLLAAALALCAVACAEFDSPSSSADCETAKQGGDRVTGDAAPIVPDGFPIRADLTVRGTARHLDDLTIRKVLVGNVIADPLSGAFNYSRWEATIPFESLQSIRPDEKSGKVSLNVVAKDACDRSYRIAEVTVVVAEQTEPSQLSELSVEIRYPPDRSYLPAQTQVPGTVVVKGNAEAAGESVELEASGGRFASSGEATATVELGEGSDGDAVAEASYFADGPGTSFVTARSNALVDSTPVEVVGPPALAPSGATLTPGSSIRVEISTDGTLASGRPCLVPPSTSFEVRSGGENLMVGGAPNDTNDDGRPDFTVSVPTSVTQDASLVVTCSDVYGQSTSATFSANASP